MLDERFVILGAIINFFGVASYLIDTIKGKTKPNRVTWSLWAIAPLIAFYAEIKQGVGLPSLMTFVQGFFPLLILAGSYINKKSYWKIGRLDITCGILSLTGILLWQVTKVGNIAILFSIIADGLAGIPTLVKSYKAPQTENYKPFIGAVINSLITIATIKIFDFAHLAFPIYIFLMFSALTLLIKFKLGRKLQKKIA